MPFTMPHAGLPVMAASRHLRLPLTGLSALPLAAMHAREPPRSLKVALGTRRREVMRLVAHQHLTGGPGTAVPGPGYRWIALSNTTLGTLMATINGSITLIALPDIFRGISPIACRDRGRGS